MGIKDRYSTVKQNDNPQRHITYSDLRTNNATLHLPRRANEELKFDKEKNSQAQAPTQPTKKTYRTRLGWKPVGLFHDRGIDGTLGCLLSL